MVRLPPLRLLVAFDAVCRLGTMQAAARHLNVTRPAITQAIKALEEHIGAPLFDRRSKPAIVTEAGERLARAPRLGLAMVEEAIEDIQLAASLSGMQLTVSCTLGMATYWLMPRLSGFYSLYPDITINVQAPPSDLPVIESGTDFALRYGTNNWNDGETFKLFDERVCPTGKENVIEAALASEGGLLTAPLIHVRTGPGNRHWAGWDDYFQKLGLKRQGGPVQVFDNYVQAVQACLDGRGIMLGWRSNTWQQVKDGTLKCWPDGEIDFGTAYYLTCAPNSQHKLGATEFKQWIIEQL